MQLIKRVFSIDSEAMKFLLAGSVTSLLGVASSQQHLCVRLRQRSRAILRQLLSLMLEALRDGLSYDPSLFRISCNWSVQQSLSTCQLVVVLSACLVGTPKSKKVLQYPSHRILRYVHEALNIGEKKTNYTVWLKIARRTF